MDEINTVGGVALPTKMTVKEICTEFSISPTMVRKLAKSMERGTDYSTELAGNGGVNRKVFTASGIALIAGRNRKKGRKFGKKIQAD